MLGVRGKRSSWSKGKLVFENLTPELCREGCHSGVSFREQGYKWAMPTADTPGQGTHTLK